MGQLWGQLSQPLFNLVFIVLLSLAKNYFPKVLWVSWGSELLNLCCVMIP